MASINKVILIGRVGQDPETSFSAGGNTQITKFSLATSEYYNKNGERMEATEWHNILLWNKLSDMYKESIKKGSLLYLEGKIKTNKWQDKDGNNRYRTEIWAGVIRILTRSENGGYNNNNNNYNNNNYNKNNSYNNNNNSSNYNNNNSNNYNNNNNPDISNEPMDEIPF